MTFFFFVLGSSYSFFYSYFQFWAVCEWKKGKGRKLKETKIHKNEENREGDWNIILLFRKAEKFQNNIYCNIVK